MKSSDPRETKKVKNSDTLETAKAKSRGDRETAKAKSRGGETARAKRREKTVEKKKKAPVVRISPLAFVPLAVFLFFSRDLTLPAALCAALLHECGHLLAIAALGGSVSRVEIYPFGGEIVRTGRVLSYAEEILLSGAGIAVNLLCAPFACARDAFPRLFGLCSLGLGLFNLLPVRGLDGGDVLENLLCLCFGVERAETPLKAVSAVTVCLLLTVGLYGALSRLFYPSFLLPALYLFFCALSGARGRKGAR